MQYKVEDLQRQFLCSNKSQKYCSTLVGLDHSSCQNIFHIDVNQIDDGFADKQNFNINRAQQKVNNKKIIKAAFQQKTEALINSRKILKPINQKNISSCLLCDKLQKMLEQSQLKVISIQNLMGARIRKIHQQNQETLKKISKSYEVLFNEKTQRVNNLQRQLKDSKLKNQSSEKSLQSEILFKNRIIQQLKFSHKEQIKRKQQQNEQEKQNFVRKLLQNEQNISKQISSIQSNNKQNNDFVIQMIKQKDEKLQFLQNEKQFLKSYYEGLLLQKAQYYRQMKATMGQQRYKVIQQIKESFSAQIHMLANQNQRLKGYILQKGKLSEAIQNQYQQVIQSCSYQNRHVMTQNKILRQKIKDIFSKQQINLKLQDAVKNGTQLNALNALQLMQNTKLKAQQSKIKFLQSQLQINKKVKGQLQQLNKSLKNKIKLDKSQSKSRQNQLIAQIALLTIEKAKLEEYIQLLKSSQLTRKPVQESSSHEVLKKSGIDQIQLLHQIIERNCCQYQMNTQNIKKRTQDLTNQLNKLKNSHDNLTRQLQIKQNQNKSLQKDFKQQTLAYQQLILQNQTILEDVQQIQQQMRNRESQLAHNREEHMRQFCLMQNKIRELQQELQRLQLKIDQIQIQKMILQQNNEYMRNQKEDSSAQAQQSLKNLRNQFEKEQLKTKEEMQEQLQQLRQFIQHKQAYIQYLTQFKNSFQVKLSSQSTELEQCLNFVLQNMQI